MPERKDYWKKVLDSAVEELTAMRAEREERAAELHDLSREIVQLEQLVKSLSPFTSEAPQDDIIRVQGVSDLELADAIREVLRVSEQHRTPRGIRDSLRASEYDLAQHTNPLASIHGVLKRLAESGEVDSLESKGKTYYRWKGFQGVTDDSDFSNRGGAEGLMSDIGIVQRRAAATKKLVAGNKKR